MTEKVESLNYREGHHPSCPKCDCTCHPRHGRDTSYDQPQTAMVGAMHYRAGIDGP